MRIFCLEDNALIVFHIEQLLEDLGHVFVGALESFADLKENFSDLEFDGALVDIDLTDGRTGPSAAAWLLERGIPTIFITGQEQIADQHRDISIAIIGKPISQLDFAQKMALFPLGNE
ncbi:response regulator [Methylobacterium sp. NEAU K]|uniref:response regulator n=1 Tax=Methylobacterium sp. NEAU K TaxID=3064946 RepID=UPI002735D6C4|nr:response regulator [Methylobacterium sp. NEAU K]MDP4006056.1 response regulator [Methylobacterium sp. NEAU K]